MVMTTKKAGRLSDSMMSVPLTDSKKMMENILVQSKCNHQTKCNLDLSILLPCIQKNIIFLVCRLIIQQQGPADERLVVQAISH